LETASLERDENKKIDIIVNSPHRIIFFFIKPLLDFCNDILTAVAVGSDEMVAYFIQKLQTNSVVQIADS